MKQVSILLLLLLVFGINHVKAQSYDTIWLSSLDITKSSTGWGKPGADVSCMGNPIVLDGVTYTRGFGTHASSAFYLKLSGGSARFHAVVGIND